MSNKKTQDSSKNSKAAPAPVKRHVKRKATRTERVIHDKDVKMDLRKHSGPYFEVVSGGVTVDVTTRSQEAISLAHKQAGNRVIVYQLTNGADTKFPVFIKNHKHVVKNLFTEQRQQVLRQKWDHNRPKAA